MRNVHIFILLLFSVLIVSCEYRNAYTYKMLNKSNQEIKIVTKNYEGIDSILIPINSQETIYILKGGVGGGRVSNHETDTHLKIFEYVDYFEVYQDSTKSKTDFSLSGEWSYKEDNAHSGTYSCEVYQSDF
ncbi:MAG: hypothetical protein KF900_05780 [Bacteroidetes bacterium]|nr:hypothetical protein [Bacteroidota bacterium]